MNGRRGEVAVRVAGLAAVTWGVLLLTRGDQLWRSVNGAPASSLDESAIRALGARHLMQGAAQVIAPEHLQRVFVAVDLSHGATMVALAAADPGRRRPALLSAGLAAASAATLLTVRAGR